VASERCSPQGVGGGTAAEIARHHTWLAGPSLYAPRLTWRSFRTLWKVVGLGRLLPRENLPASVYGTVLVSSVIVGLGQAEDSAGWMMATVTVTALVFSLAHGWANALGRSATDRQPMSLELLLEGIRYEWPMAEAVMPALVALGLAALDVYSIQTGLWVAIVANTVLLFVWGARLRQRAEGTPVQIFVAGLMTSTLGLVLVVLKAVVH
jgi:hypothetical protein